MICKGAPKACSRPRERRRRKLASRVTARLQKTLSAARSISRRTIPSPTHLPRITSRSRLRRTAVLRRRSVMMATGDPRSMMPSSLQRSPSILNGRTQAARQARAGHAQCFGSQPPTPPRPTCPPPLTGPKWRQRTGPIGSLIRSGLLLSRCQEGRRSIPQWEPRTRTGCLAQQQLPPKTLPLQGTQITSGRADTHSSRPTSS